MKQIKILAFDPGFNIADVHRDVLGEVFDENGFGGSAEDRRAIAERWHQLDTWPDFAVTLRRLRQHRICVSFTILRWRFAIQGGPPRDVPQNHHEPSGC